MSLGVYPGDPCYDAGRPNWLPYWIDDFTESDCKFGATNIAGATINAFESPGVVAQNVGGVIGQGAGAAVSDVASGAGSAVGGLLTTISFGGWLLIAAVLGGIALVSGARR